LALALPLLAGFALAPILGGRWSRIGTLRVRIVWLFYVAIALQLVAFPVKVLPWHTSDRIGVVLWLISYGLFSAGVAANVRIPGIPFIAAGLVSNLVAILSNGGHMPALPSALRAAGMHFTTGHNRNSAVLPSPHVALLVDRWAAPAWVPWANVFSVGDVLIALGGLVFALGATGALRRASPVLESDTVPKAKAPLRLLESPLPDERDQHLYLVPMPNGYELRECPGAAPLAGTVVDLGEGLWGEVVKVARSPLPNDERRCAYLVQATVEEEIPSLALVSSG
jgi:Family of unknown function (DUF5317)